MPGSVCVPLGTVFTVRVSDPFEGVGTVRLPLLIISSLESAIPRSRTYMPICSQNLSRSTREVVPGGDVL